ncbi:helix-turn-helix domain-containing protein [Leifsonia sp. NPDC058248]|uniref:helix-turn-helix domain-containing protein n=1 Tax=Leifsonia sp. NPDC058248 TaxID=3346402 RepID=UPI0036DC656E
MGDDIREVLATAGARIRAIRESRRMTLTAAANASGISLSTLSRLESGSRRATLELLLPLARLYRVPLDDLVGAPPTGDPRVHPRPFLRNGVTTVPLSRSTAEWNAFKQILPPRPDAEYTQRVHDGWDWLYVISGRLRLMLGDEEFLLEPGEAADFDTRTPHAFGNPEPEVLEVLCLFNSQGERMHVRAAAAPLASAGKM